MRREDAKPVYDRILERCAREGACLIWKGRSFTKAGHGRMFVGSRTDGTRRNASVHCLIWAHFHGPIPDGMVVAHTCDHPPCVDERHLFLTTPTGNMADRDAKGRQARGERQGLSKLTELDVRRMREMRAQGTLIRDLSAEFRITPPNVSYICNRRTWKHVA